MSVETIKCVSVGDGAIGKTSYIVNYTSNTFSHDYTRTELEIRAAMQMMENKPVNLTLWDTGGQDDWRKERKIAYKDADIILLTFSIPNFSSFKNIKKKWLPEIQHYCPNTPYILVGTKLDLRENYNAIKALKKDGKFAVTYEEGKELAEQINALDYIECSALTQEGISELFAEVIKKGLETRKRKKDGTMRETASSGGKSKCIIE